MTKENFIQLPSGPYSIEGHTASGKSELLKFLIKFVFGAVGIDETSPTKNPAHEEYYQALKNGTKPNPFAFKSQMFFLVDSIAQSFEVEMKMKEAPVIWGGPPWHHFMYVHLLHQDGILTDEDYQCYCDVLVRCLPIIPSPIMRIHTRRQTGEHTKEAIKTRAKNSTGAAKEARMAEVGVPVAYWESQIDYWEILTKAGLLLPEEVNSRLGVSTPEIPIVTLDPDEINWLTEDGQGNPIENEAGRQTVLSQIAAALEKN